MEISSRFPLSMFLRILILFVLVGPHRWFYITSLASQRVTAPTLAVPKTAVLLLLWEWNVS